MPVNSKTKVDVPQTVTRDQLAQLLGVHPDTVTKWEKDDLPKLSRGKYPLSSCIQWHSIHEVKMATKRFKKGDMQLTKEEWELRKKAADALLAEITVAKERSQLIPIARIETDLIHQLESVRTALRAIAGRWAGELLGIETKPEAQKRLERLVDDLMLAASVPSDLPDLDTINQLDEDSDETESDTKGLD